VSAAEAMLNEISRLKVAIIEKEAKLGIDSRAVGQNLAATNTAIPSMQN
jgi:hypothetical protein